MTPQRGPEHGSHILPSGLTFRRGNIHQPYDREGLIALFNPQDDQQREDIGAMVESLRGHDHLLIAKVRLHTTRIRQKTRYHVAGFLAGSALTIPLAPGCSARWEDVLDIQYLITHWADHDATEQWLFEQASKDIANDGKRFRHPVSRTLLETEDDDQKMDNEYYTSLAQTHGFTVKDVRSGEYIWERTPGEESMSPS